jgi:hypothetical protein
MNSALNKAIKKPKKYKNKFKDGLIKEMTELGYLSNNNQSTFAIFKHWLKVFANLNVSFLKIVTILTVITAIFIFHNYETLQTVISLIQDKNEYQELLGSYRAVIGLFVFATYAFLLFYESLLLSNKEKYLTAISYFLTVLVFLLFLNIVIIGSFDYLVDYQYIKVVNITKFPLG